MEELTTRIVDLNTKLKTIKKKQGLIIVIKIQNEPIVALKDKVRPQTYYCHRPGKVLIDETPTKIKVYELH
jgi:hypothetical protein